MNELKKDAIWVRLQEQRLDVGAVDAFLRTEGAGGIDIFVGTTRRWTGDDETEVLSYECYPSMAVKEMQRLAEQARERWPVLRVCIMHRTGVVPVAEASVVIGVASAHRAEAFEACRWLIDTLKQQVPIWKKETYRDGRTEWVQGSVPADNA